MSSQSRASPCSPCLKFRCDTIESNRRQHTSQRQMTTLLVSCKLSFSARLLALSLRSLRKVHHLLASTVSAYSGMVIGMIANPNAMMENDTEPTFNQILNQLPMTFIGRMGVNSMSWLDSGNCSHLMFTDIAAPIIALLRKISMDPLFQAPVTGRGNDAIIVVVDRMSKMVRIDQNRRDCIGFCKAVGEQCCHVSWSSKGDCQIEMRDLRVISGKP